MGFFKSYNQENIVPEAQRVVVNLPESSSSGDEESHDDVQERRPENRKQGKHYRNKCKTRLLIVLDQLQDDITDRSNRFGRRKTRRIENEKILRSLLKEEDQIDDEIYYKPSVFSTLAIDERAMKIWEAFMAKTENEQLVYLENILLSARKKKMGKLRENCV